MFCRAFTVLTITFETLMHQYTICRLRIADVSSRCLHRVFGSVTFKGCVYVRACVHVCVCLCVCVCVCGERETERDRKRQRNTERNKERDRDESLRFIRISHGDNELTLEHRLSNQNSIMNKARPMGEGR